MTKTEALVMTKLMWDYMSTVNITGHKYHAVDSVKELAIEELGLPSGILLNNFNCALCAYVEVGKLLGRKGDNICEGKCPLYALWVANTDNYEDSLLDTMACVSSGSPYVLADDCLMTEDQENFSYNCELIADACEKQLKEMS